jgi:iron(III) transport system substrate-binding protein
VAPAVQQTSAPVQAPAEAQTAATAPAEEAETAAEEAQPEEAQPEAAAAPSGTITLYTSESEDQVNEMVADFNRLYPDVTVDIFRTGSGEVVAKLQAEMEAGEIQADVIWFADIDFFSRLADEELLMAYAPQGGENIPAGYHYDGDKYHEVRLIFNVVAYNTGLVPEVPTSWKDLLDPQYQGKVGMPSALYSGAAFNQVGTLMNNPDFGWEFYEQLNENGVVVERGNGGVADKVATGEFAIVQVVDFMARNLKNQGSPVDHIWPEEGALLVPTPIGIISNTDNPDAAKAFLDYMYTDSAQSLFVQQGYVAVVPGTPLPEGAPDMADLEVLTVDTEYISNHRDEIRSNFEQTFGTAE